MESEIAAPPGDVTAGSARVPGTAPAAGRSRPILVAWWVVHVHRKAQPALLPAGFSLTVCSTLLGVVAVLLLVFGIADVAHGIDSTDGVIGCGDLVATGATMMAAALLSWAALAWQATRPARNLTAGP